MNHQSDYMKYIFLKKKKTITKEGGMAITITPKKDIFECLDVNKGLINVFQSLGGKVDTGINKIVVSVPGQLPSAIKVPTGALGSIFNNMLAGHSKESLKGTLECSIKKMIDAHAGANPDSPIHMEAETTPMEAETTHAQSIPTGGGVEITPAEPQNYCSDIEMQTLPPVALLTASRMYQPIKGTTIGTRYFLIASAPEGNIAARYKGTQLSLRVEGKITSAKHTMQENGFNVAPGYASLHLTCPDTMMLKRAVGAVLLGLQLKYTTPFPEVTKIIGKGV